MVGPITLDNTMAYYGANDYSGQDVRPDEMVIDACKKAESMVDFTIYDRDNDRSTVNISMLMLVRPSCWETVVLLGTESVHFAMNIAIRWDSPIFTIRAV